MDEIGSLCCQIRLELANQYATAARLSSEAVAVMLAAPIRTMLDYEGLRKRAAKAQEAAEAARIAFEEHVEMHRCIESRQASRAQEVGKAH